MIDITDKSNCCGCGACAKKCPKNCILMNFDDEGFCYPEVNRNLCVHCNLCDSVCPVLNKRKNDKELITSRAFAAYNKNNDELLHSSSGGIFSLLAKQVLINNGVVFGAAYCEDFVVKHVAVKSQEDIAKLRGSKYVQSDIQESYQLAEKFLKENVEVLFSGTPCQIEGLLSYLGDDYKNLITIDLICSGVPSPKLWKEYIDYREDKLHSKISQINLRYKKYGWQEYVALFNYENGKQYTKTRFEDPFMRAFRDGYSLRPSCYNCQFKTVERNSDITLADFWGIETVMPDINNHSGTSMVFVNTEQGERLFSSISNDIISAEVDKQIAVSCNPMMNNSFKKPPMREDFYQFVSNNSFIKATEKYCKIPIKQKLKFKTDALYLRLKERLNNDT